MQAAVSVKWNELNNYEKMKWNAKGTNLCKYVPNTNVDQTEVAIWVA